MSHSQDSRRVTPENFSYIGAALCFALTAMMVAVRGYPSSLNVVLTFFAVILVAPGWTLLWRSRRALRAWRHWTLGLCLGLAPFVTWILARRHLDVLPVFLSVALVFWVAGYDIVDACKDISGDRKRGSFSLPARWGARRALVISAGCHVAAVWLLALFGQLADLGALYFFGLVLITPVLYWVHRTARPETLSRGRLAVMVGNSSSLLLLAATALDFILVTGKMRI